MGSSGTGRFGDYPPSGLSNTPPSDGTDLCSKPLLYVQLEDVGQSEYYNNRNSVPNTGHPVNIRLSLYNGRVVVETSDLNEILGNLPTSYNYVFFTCMKSGICYEGAVISSGLKPIPYVVVNLNAIK